MPAQILSLLLYNEIGCYSKLVVLTVLPGTWRVLPSYLFYKLRRLPVLSQFKYTLHSSHWNSAPAPMDGQQDHYRLQHLQNRLESQALTINNIIIIWSLA